MPHRDKIELYEDTSGRWCWRRRARNGRILCSGEQHRDARDAERAARRACPDVDDVRKHLGER